MDYKELKAKYDQDIKDLQMRCKHPKDKLTPFNNGFGHALYGDMYLYRACTICGKIVSYKIWCVGCKREMIRCDIPPHHYYCGKCLKIMERGDVK